MILSLACLGHFRWVFSLLCYALRAIVGYMMEHEDVIKLPVNLKELQNKIKQAHTKLTQVQVMHAFMLHANLHEHARSRRMLHPNCSLPTLCRVAVFASVRSVSTCCMCMYTTQTYPANTAARMGELYHKKLATVFPQGPGKDTMKCFTPVAPF